MDAQGVSASLLIQKEITLTRVRLRCDPYQYLPIRAPHQLARSTVIRQCVGVFANLQL